MCIRDSQDVGKAIHPSYVEGQIQGGAAQGIGWALSEEYIYNSKGQMENPGFLDYRCPVASDVPMIEAVLVLSLIHIYSNRLIGFRTDTESINPIRAINAAHSALPAR